MPPDATIGITHSAADDVWLVHLRGEHDLASQEDLIDVLDGIGPTRRIVIDLTEAAFIDSTIIGTLVKQARDAEPAGGTLILAVAKDTTPERTIDIMRLGGILLVYESLDEAISSLGATKPASPDHAHTTTAIRTTTP